MFSALLQFFGLVLTRCYGEYGCYSLGGSLYSPYRPINVFPMSPDVINVTYLFYSRYADFRGVQINDYHNFTDMPVSSVCVTCDTKLLVHGFTESNVKPWVKVLARELLRKDDFNVVIVNWRNGALPPYTQAAANARIVGNIASKFVQALMDRFNVTASSFHVIGHSLGVHVAAYIGQEIRGLGRITGLDPAKPYFENMHPDIRLDATDADFVDVIHTDTGFSSRHLDGIGFHEAIGHLDFYPNGGRTQPGCGEGLVKALKRAKGKLTYEIKEYLLCNHKRSYMYFIESINGGCPLLAAPCDSWDKYLRGECFDCSTGSCSPMGYHASLPRRLDASRNATPTTENNSTSGILPSSQKMFLFTGQLRPYCKNHYRITISVAEGHYGKLYFTLAGERADSWRILFNSKEILFADGKEYTSVIGERDVGAVSGLALQWEVVRKTLDPYTWYIWRKPALLLASARVDHLETGQTTCFNMTGIELHHGNEFVVNSNACPDDVTTTPPTPNEK